MFILKSLGKIPLTALYGLFAAFFMVSAVQSQENEKFKSADEIESFFLKTRGVEKKTELIDLVLPLEVNFKLNSDKLTRLAQRQLDNLATVLLKPNNKNLKLELAGHTCDLGGEAFNMDLSLRRINSAFNYLKEKYGIDESRLSTIAYGESLPVIANASTEAERSVNRRVVVYLPDNRLIIESILKKKPEEPGFQWAVFHYTIDNKTRLINYDGSSVLESNDQYRVYIRPHKTKYVYIYQKDAHGNNEWLFPRKESSFRNPLNPGEYYLPDRSHVFVLDDNTGTETISILATDNPISELDAIISGQSSQSYNDIIDKVVKTRGLKVTRIAPAPKGPDTEEGNIKISELEEKKEPVTKSLDKLSEIITAYDDFYMEVQFDHQ